MKKIILSLFFVYGCNVNALRDPFKLDLKYALGCNLLSGSVVDLVFLGAIHMGNRAIGFVEDPFGNICQIKLGQKIGLEHSQVVTIAAEQIILWDGQKYAIIKS